MKQNGKNRNSTHGKAAFRPEDSQRTLHENLQFTAIEQYKLLRENLSFVLPSDRKCAVIGVTSSMRGEGKSTTAVNLAYVLAEKGKRVILIDGDLRIPSIAKKMRIESSPGLTDLLRSADVKQLNLFRSTQYTNWYIMPSGELPPNPSELLGSSKMKNILEALSENFDYIVIDLPPVNLVSDAIAVSKYTTGMVLVIREDYTEKKELDNCFRQLELSNVNILGCVMNESKGGNGYYKKKKSYYRYYKRKGDYTQNS